MTDALAVSTIALQGAAVGVSAELAIRTLNNKSDKIPLQVRLGKFIMGLTMAIKSMVFLSFHAIQGESCYITGRVADAFYHIAMTAGTAVLVARVQSIIPVFWQRRTNILHNIIILLRFFVGVVDTALIHISAFDDGSCKYRDEEFVRLFYFFYFLIIKMTHFVH
jgi:uncharacterized membrane protein HdeD (DUF308 family)